MSRPEPAPAEHFSQPYCEMHGLPLFPNPPLAVKAVRLPENIAIDAGPISEHSSPSFIPIAHVVGFIPTFTYHHVTEWLPSGDWEPTGCTKTYYTNRRYGLFAVAPESSLTVPVERQRERRAHIDWWVDADDGLMAEVEYEERWVTW